MKLSDYLKDKILYIFIYLMMEFFIITLLLLFNSNIVIVLSISLILVLTFILIILLDYSNKNKFYNYMNIITENIDQKFLVNEIVKEPEFIEGKLFMNYLYDINKSYLENINKYKSLNEEFKDYIELWCHEIKTPIATSKLIIQNNKNKINDSIQEEIDNIESFVEQVLYYARSENVNKDYFINNINLNEVVNNVIKKNKKTLISKHIKINMFKDDVMINSDSKWLEYIINQIINNSIKYTKENPLIDINIEENKNNIILSIKDNGIGINEEDIDKVFRKGFTGNNGRLIKTSTGMGLYLCKELCQKLGHEIIINSNIEKGTIVYIIFPNNSLTNVK